MKNLTKRTKRIFHFCSEGPNQITTTNLANRHAYLCYGSKNARFPLDSSVSVSVSFDLNRDTYEPKFVMSEYVRILEPIGIIVAIKNLHRRDRRRLF